MTARAVATAAMLAACATTTTPPAEPRTDLLLTPQCLGKSACECNHPRYCSDPSVAAPCCNRVRYGTIGAVSELADVTKSPGQIRFEMQKGYACTEEANALALEEEGKTFLSQGNIQQAYVRFWCAAKRTNAYTAMGNLGLAEKSLGMSDTAANHLAQCLATWPPGERVKARPLVQAELDKLEQSLVRIVISTDAHTDLQVSAIEEDDGPLAVSATHWTHYVRPSRRYVVTASAPHVLRGRVIVASAIVDCISHECTGKRVSVAFSIASSAAKVTMP